MSVDYITQKMHNMNICVNIKDRYNHSIYDLKTITPIIYTEDVSSTTYYTKSCISPNPTMYVCPSPPRAHKNDTFCWSHALE